MKSGKEQEITALAEMESFMKSMGLLRHPIYTDMPVKNNQIMLSELGYNCFMRRNYPDTMLGSTAWRKGKNGNEN